MELSFNFIAVIFITIRALAKSKIITYVRGKLKNLHDEIKCFSIIDFNCFSNPFRNFFLFHDKYLQTVVTQYFVNNKSEIWS